MVSDNLAEVTCGFFTSNIGCIIENKHNDAGVDLNKKQL